MDQARRLLYSAIEKEKLANPVRSMRFRIASE